MIPDVGQLVAATVTELAPYMPYLINAGAAGASKLAEVIAEKGGEAAWHKAQAIWARITSRFGQDAEITSAATMVAAKPNDEMRQTMLAEVLAARINADPTFAQELFDAIGNASVQQVIVERSSFVENVTQRLHGSGTQTIKASTDSRISGVQQIKD